MPKIRDEKAAAAAGALSDRYYERTAEERLAMANLTYATSIRGSNPKSKRTKHRKVRYPYAPLHTLSGYAFGRSTMLVEEIVMLAFYLGCPAVAIADPFSLAGAMELALACESLEIKPIIGASFELTEGGEIVLIAKTPQGYKSLSNLITECHLKEPRGFPLATWERLAAHAQDLLCLTGGDVGPIDRLLIRRDFESAATIAERLVRIYGRKNVFVEIERSFLPWSIMVEHQLLDLAEKLKLTPVAAGVMTHATPTHFPAQDILVCAETLCLIDEISGRKPSRDELQPCVKQGPGRALNAERFLRGPNDMAALYADRPDLLENTLRVADLCDPWVLRERLVMAPMPTIAQDGDDNRRIHELVETEARKIYGPSMHPDRRKRIRKELNRIVELGSASHFLIAHDFCNWAAGQGIGFSGRGSVVDSVVAYILGLSRIDAFDHDLHFERFLPGDRSKRPDIDIDFESKRRDDVRNYLVNKFGIEHVAAVCAIGTYRTRGIIREVGKAFGIPNEILGFLAKRLHGSVTPERLESAIDARPELRDSGIPREHFLWTFELANRLKDIPRNIRLHSSGVVLSSIPIRDLVPVMWSASEGVEEGGLRMIQWDKRSSKYVFDKFDILCLRGQDVLGGFEARRRKHDPSFSSNTIDALEDPEVYRAVRAGELIGIPQSASPAMRQAHQRVKTKDLHEASLVQAGIRPGVGGAVKLNELIQRKNGKDYKFDHPDFEPILNHTYGIIVFQEQVDLLLQNFCGYSSGEAEDIRDAIYKQRKDEFVDTVRNQIVSKAKEKGYSEPIAIQVFEMVAQFKGYGFAQGHALAFAEVSLRSVWCQQNYPAPYFAALLEAQPAGYYGPTTIANEARVRGVRILPPDVSQSGIGFNVEDITAEDDPKVTMPEGGIRTALNQISGISKDLRERLLFGQPYASFFDCVTRTNPNRDELERLILCGAFDALHPNRRALLWAIPHALEHGATLRGALGALPLGFEDPPIPSDIEDFRPGERSVYERRILDMDIERHLMGYERERVRSKGGITAREASNLQPGQKVFVVGNPIRLRFPPTQSGRRVMFFDLEDETGLLNATCFDEVYQRDGHKVICHPYVTLWGETQDRDGHLSFLVSRIYAYDPVLLELTSDPSPLPIVTADFLMT